MKTLTTLSLTANVGAGRFSAWHGRGSLPFVSFAAVRTLFDRLRSSPGVARSLLARLRREAEGDELLVEWIRHKLASLLADRHLREACRPRRPAPMASWLDVPDVDDGVVVEGQVFDGSDVELGRYLAGASL
jgi:hypothetical protein